MKEITTASWCWNLSFYFTNETSLSRTRGRGNKEKSTGEKDLSTSKKCPAVSDYDRPTRSAFSVFIRRAEGKRDLFHAVDVSAVDLTRDDDSTKRRNSRHGNSCARAVRSLRAETPLKRRPFFLHCARSFFIKRSPIPRQCRFFAEIRR